MQLKNSEENATFLINILEDYFKKNVTSFYQIDGENDMDFELTCVIYRSYMVRFTLGDCEKGGAFGIDIFIGSGCQDLGLLVSDEDADKLFVNFDEKGIRDSLKILDGYLQWRMTDAQKKTFNLI